MYKRQNLANAVAAQAATANLNCFIFIPSDLELGKVVGSQIHNPTVVGIHGVYDDVNRLCSEIADAYPWAFANINIRPFYAEGSKTLCYEVLEQLGWRSPDHFIAPAAGGSLITKIGKAIKEFRQLGLIEKSPTQIHVAQAEGVFAVEHIAGLAPQPLDYNAMPRAVYCNPQIASIGLTEKEATDKGYSVKVGKFPFLANGKSLTADEREGFVKIVGEAWKKIWRERIEKTPLYAENWLSHQLRDETWINGSICEDYDKINIPIMAISGWYDCWPNTVIRLLENITSPVKAISGSWAHEYPHLNDCLLYTSDAADE